MNDSKIVNIARRIDRLNTKIHELVWEIRGSDHPNKDEIVQALWDNMFDVPAQATHVISHRLEHADKWETTETGIRRKHKPADAQTVAEGGE